SMSVNALKEALSELIKLKEDHLALQFSSFGYKFGIPLDADFIFDVRCLPNPHYESNLKNLTGLDNPVAEFFQGYEEVDKMYQDINHFVGEWLRAFKKDQRHSLHIAIGCTGGKHRSVYIANKLFANFFNPKSQVTIRHRDINH
ncbi:MAG TPA: RNase adaptor protein RapZ, partial [Methylophilaceae bacterium]|nr:RNase adaptor protein RapZ [Methylophilaceae bacterium]